jgi:hypothetical protein
MDDLERVLNELAKAGLEPVAMSSQLSTGRMAVIVRRSVQIFCAISRDWLAAPPPGRWCQVWQ